VHKLLIVDDEAPIRDMMAMFAQDLGFIPVLASDGDVALQMFRQEYPPIVLTDVRMPKMDGITFTQRLKEESPETYVIMLTGHGGEETAIAALKAGASGFLKKPLEIEDLKATLNKFSQAVSARTAAAKIAWSFSGLRLNATVESDPDKAAGVSAFLLRGLEGALGKREMADLQLGMCELLLNAIEHGNLGISTEEKRWALANGNFDALLEERQACPDLGQRSVSIEVILDQASREIRCHFRDQGDGFDWQALPQELTPENLLKPQGRGIILARMVADRLEYNNKGNEVTFVKRIGQ